MVVGTLKIKLLIGEAMSLKDKRRVIKSVIGKITSEFRVSAAEVDLNDSWKSAVIGVSCVSNESSHADSILTSVTNFIESRGDIEVISCETELIHL